jgi:hypothetical protein
MDADRPKKQGGRVMAGTVGEKMKIKRLDKTTIIVAAIYANVAVFFVLLFVKYSLNHYAHTMDKWGTLSLSSLALLACLHSISIRGIWLRGYVLSKDENPLGFCFFLVLEFVTSVILLVRFIRWR